MLKRTANLDCYNKIICPDYRAALLDSSQINQFSLQLELPNQKGKTPFFIAAERLINSLCSWNCQTRKVKRRSLSLQNVLIETSANYL